MPKHTVLIEVMDGAPQAFKLHAAARESLRESESQVEKLAKGLAGLGVDIDASFPPVPMFFGLDKPSKTHLEAFGTFAAATESSDAKSASFVLRAEVDAPALKKLKQRQGVRVYPASRLYLFAPCSCGGSPAAPALDGGRRETVDDELELDWGHTAGSTDCRPFRAGVSMARIRALLGVSAVWRDGAGFLLPSAEMTSSERAIEIRAAFERAHAAAEALTDMSQGWPPRCWLDPPSR